MGIQERLGITKGVSIMILIQLILIVMGVICEAYDLYYIFFESPMEGSMLAKNAVMHLFTLGSYGILALYATVGWKKLGTIHFKGVLYIFILTLIADVVVLYDAVGIGGAIVVAVDVFFILVLHQKLRDERDAELINWLLILINLGCTIALFITKPEIIGLKVFDVLFYLSPFFISVVIALDYEGNFDRIAIRRSDR